MENTPENAACHGWATPPGAQVSLHDSAGRFLGRPDLYYPDRRLWLEYDGATHRESLVADNRRQNRLVNAGFRLVRLAAADIFQSPESVIGQVRLAISQRRAWLQRHT